MTLIKSTSTLTGTRDPLDPLGLIISGSELADKITGSNFNDTIFGNGGDDSINGGAGDDAIYGGAGNDILYGGTGNDRLDGGSGNDTMSGGAGSDTFTGGSGADTVTYAGTATGIRVHLNADWTGSSDGEFGAAGDNFTGVENIIGTAFSDEIIGDAADNKFSGGGARDFLFGGDGADWLLGEDGDDDLSGGEGFDVLNGGAGRDTLFGGDGVDIMYGGADRDTFTVIFDEAPQYEDADIIADFVQGEDIFIFDLQLPDNATLRYREGAQLPGSGADVAYDGITRQFELFLDTDDHMLYLRDRNFGWVDTVASVNGLTHATEVWQPYGASSIALF